MSLAPLARRPAELPADGAAPGPAAAAAVAPVIRLDKVTKRFGGVTALDGISLDIRAGEILGIIGRSGAGKSTLIRCLNGLERPDSGRVEILGQDLTPLDRAGLRRLRARIGMIFQHFNLLSARRVADNVALPLKIAGVPKAERRTAVDRLLGLVGLADKAASYPAQLSGGQKQRVGIARALAAQPALLLSDEATSALDSETTRSILALLKDINRQLGLTIVLITHEMSVVREIADRVVVLDHGRIVEEGPVGRVFGDPQAPLTIRLIGAERHALPAGLEAQLRPTWAPGREVILRLHLAGDGAGEPLLADLATSHGLRPRLLHGHLEQIQGEYVGTALIAVPCDLIDASATVLSFLSARAVRAESLGYVERVD